MATYGNGLKVYGSATSGGTVPANSFAVCTYHCTSQTALSYPGHSTATSVVTKIFAAGSTISATFTAVIGMQRDGASTNTTLSGTYTFNSGVILTNS